MSKRHRSTSGSPVIAIDDPDLPVTELPQETQSDNLIMGLTELDAALVVDYHELLDWRDMYNLALVSKAHHDIVRRYFIEKRIPDWVFTLLPRPSWTKRVMLDVLQSHRWPMPRKPSTCTIDHGGRDSPYIKIGWDSLTAAPSQRPPYPDELHTISYIKITHRGGRSRSFVAYTIGMPHFRCSFSSMDCAFRCLYLEIDEFLFRQPIDLVDHAKMAIRALTRLDRTDDGLDILKRWFPDL